MVVYLMILCGALLVVYLLGGAGVISDLLGSDDGERGRHFLL